jgi:predicted nucleic acid-binding protein
MPDLIFDNCVLSNFALTESMAILISLYERRAYVSDLVLLENLRGIQKGHDLLSAIPKGIEEGWMRRVSIRGEKERRTFESLSTSLGAGGASSIAIARERGFSFACDDKLARREATLSGVLVTGTIGILVKAVEARKLNLDEANRILERMLAIGFYGPVQRIARGMIRPANRPT